MWRLHEDVRSCVGGTRGSFLSREVTGYKVMDSEKEFLFTLFEYRW